MVTPAQFRTLQGKPKPAPVLPGAILRWTANGWTTSGVDVLTLTDSVNGVVATGDGAASAKPQVSSINGRAAWAHGGNSWFLGSFLETFAGNELTLAIVTKPAPPDANQWAFTGGKTGALTTPTIQNFCFVGYAQLALRLDAWFAEDLKITSGLTTNPQVQLYTAERVSAAGVRKLRLWIDDTLAGSKDDGGAFTFDTTTNWVIGANADVSSPTNAIIGEVQVGTTFLDDARAAAFAAALGAAWGIT